MIKLTIYNNSTRYIMNLKKIQRVFLFILSMLFFVGCTQSDSDIVQDRIERKMGWLYSAKPDQDFQEAIKRKDYRFIGIYGYTMYVPEVNLTCISNEEDVKPIEGTSDAVFSYEHSKLIAIAQVYAKSYNIRMLEFRKEKLGLKCDL